MEFFDIFIFNNVKSDLKIILCQPNKVVPKIKVLRCNVYTYTESPNGQRLGRHTYGKRRNCTLCIAAVAILAGTFVFGWCDTLLALEQAVEIREVVETALLCHFVDRLVGEL